MATKRRLSGGGGATFGGGGTLPSPLSHSLAYLRRNQKGNREKRDGDQIYRRGANADGLTQICPRMAITGNNSVLRRSVIWSGDSPDSPWSLGEQPLPLAGPGSRSVAQSPEDQAWQRQAESPVSVAELLFTVLPAALVKLGPWEEEDQP
ncbi:uncharacterized protein LOC116761622 isoform X3 [Phocoena sinus]|uniref:uncharacterized protein LOC116761622 isoform X3 n=1 Tax=Phocoena sinus TaxID=42100 RepID=UPI0013C44E30|nr:uncharacterized protein LOC116761622 isoform X3 [Phocoena sinus]